MFNEKLVKALEIEQEELLKKINDTREKGDYGTYKNLIKALTDVVMLTQREYDRQPKVQTYEMYVDWNRYDAKDNTLIEVHINYKGEIHRVIGSLDYITSYIKELCKEDNLYIYADCELLGHVIGDSLSSKGLEISPTIKVSYNQNQGHKDPFKKRVYHEKEDKFLNRNK
jgi:hypothetical protein